MVPKGRPRIACNWEMALSVAAARLGSVLPGDMPGRVQPARPKAATTQVARRRRMPTAADALRDGLACIDVLLGSVTVQGARST
jgi:hypothetical protein